jgi:hypothetical protein
LLLPDCYNFEQTTDTFGRLARRAVGGVRIGLQEQRAAILMPEPRRRDMDRPRLVRNGQ